MGIIDMLNPLWERQESRAARDLQRFRKKHCPGQQVQGRIVKYQGHRLAWVSLQGFDLLAYLQTSPPEGKEVWFNIEQLYPQVVLKEQAYRNPGVNVYI